ncbi:DsbA family protein [Rhizobium leguminosarum]
MTGKTHITYLFDPLCGWCYGASPLLAQLAAAPDLTVSLAPTGLFSDSGARAMDEQFAAFAWSNDQRIGSLTGQRFSDVYRSQVLAKGGMLDSGPFIQEARYVSGRDVTDMSELQSVLVSVGLDAAASRLASPDSDLLAANRARMASARALTREFAVNGVPGLIVDDGADRTLLKAQDLFSGGDLLARLSNTGASPARLGRNSHPMKG